MVQRYRRGFSAAEMNKILKKILKIFGLFGVAQRVNWALRARAWLPWQPLIPEKQFMESCNLAIETLRAAGHEFGDYLEFGVSRGTSMACMYHVMRDSELSGVRLLGFDSFAGLPSEAEGQGWKPGSYASTIATTTRYLKKAGIDPGEIYLIKGWFRDTLNPMTVAQYKIRKASLIMVDCDIYSASKEALWFCEQLILDRAIIIFDDWGWRADIDKIGQREAFAEFLKEFSHFTSEPLPAYIPQARMFMVTRSASPD